jgi:hypothetical protein
LVNRERLPDFSLRRFRYTDSRANRAAYAFVLVYKNFCDSFVTGCGKNGVVWTNVLALSAPETVFYVNYVFELVFVRWNRNVKKADERARAAAYAFVRIN